ncbi:MAG: N-acetyltransferase family protein, partial [Acutalibacteraceae bacterium]|nr:N-acetyltransferase family protein [Acutalibacteraceae bacterium]
DEFRRRIECVLNRYPYLVAEIDGEIVGYAYATAFHERPAYGWGAETSIYVKQDMKKRGIGKALYMELERLLTLQNILNLNACIAYPETEDEYLTKNSVSFHQHLGYRLVGEFYKCGFKFNRWYNVVWMEKHIGVHSDNPLKVKTFNEIKQEGKL